MRDIFISYVGEDGAITADLVKGLEAAGFSAWYYERDPVPGVSYLVQTKEAIEGCQAVILIVSHNSVKSHQISREVVRAHESNKPIIPLRFEISDEEFKGRQPEWEEALGAATTIALPPEGVLSLLPLVLRGLQKMGIQPNPQAMTGELKGFSGALRSLENSSGPPSTAFPKVQDSPRKNNYLIAVAALAVIIGGIGYWLITRQATKPKLRTSEFHELFTDLSRWTAPASGWSTKDERLHLENQPSLGYPSGANFGDFTMQFNLTLNNAGGAAWALRAKDPHNYYLFYLSGPEGAKSGFFQVYIVRDDILGTPVTLIPIVTKLAAGGEYRIYISARGNVISHRINSVEDPSTDPNGDPLGDFTDEDNHFPYGNIGFRTIGGEKFSISDLYVWPPESRKPL